MNIIKQFEQEQIQTLIKNKKISDFRPGDTVKVTIKLIDKTFEKDFKEKTTERLQIYEGVVIGKRNSGINSSFIVRKISHGEGVERRFMIYSPMIHSIDTIKYGIVRRAKLYYLRKLSGKAARIKEKLHLKSSAIKNKLAKNRVSLETQ